ncbi:dCMP deaminase family protein [Propionivibrio dicarboxylicus]|uniref:dCMP deaminase n=1 Tax=Propionivibrio dicarboxylicus TaxID=83767 RepID=A0A1G8C874_9RHOO|nr:dCMP deaminase family protein [Propionivibrio dicarboxylicus]SDH41582.1 dCMP deaminase [Propionivibrio dicarboxylicus]
MSKWDRRFFHMALLVAKWSKDPSTTVGAVIVDQHNRVVSIGFNGLPRSVCDDDTIINNRDEKLRCTIHAEENAILFARGAVDGCTIYTTHTPCAGCAAKIIQCGIVRVVSPRPSIDFATRWKEHLRSATRMFIEANVQHDYIELCE